MDLGQFQDVDSLTETSVDTFILTLPVDDLSLVGVDQSDDVGILTNNDDCDQDVPPTSSLVRSECGQLFLVTYDTNKQVTTKHCINVQIKEDLFEFKCSDVRAGGKEVFTRAQHSSLACSRNSDQMTEADGRSQIVAPPIPQESPEEKSANLRDALQLAMQEIVSDTDLFEPVPYEVKLAALNAMIPDEPSTDDNFSCAICSKNFVKKQELKDHLSRHFGLNLSLCPICGKQFSHASNLSRHIRIHTGIKPYKCKQCGKRFNQANSLRIHCSYVHSSASNHKFGCPSCGRVYKTVQLLKRHLKGCHSNDEIELILPPKKASAQRQFYCAECGESFQVKSDLKKHHLEQHAPEPMPSSDYQSNIAEEKPVDSNVFQMNIDAIDCMLREIQAEDRPEEPDTITDTIEEVISKVNAFTCLECDKKFLRYLSYKQHWGVHETSLRKFECDVCGISFAWKSTYYKHYTQYHSTGPALLVSCTQPDCLKKYKSTAQMQEHVRRDHERVRRHSCDVCHKQFFKGHDLSVHKRTHTKEKPYMCGTCGKYFSHLSHVIRHENSHNNIRPYSCPICNKSFTQAAVLKTHRKKKCPEPPPVVPAAEELLL